VHASIIIVDYEYVPLVSFKKYMPQGRGGGIYFLNETSACDMSITNC
jgi:hypothetical protein